MMIKSPLFDYYVLKIGAPLQDRSGGRVGLSRVLGASSSFSFFLGRRDESRWIAPKTNRSAYALLL
jgi:hypothetical protein